jgi:predicted Fe-Mo cluster-binding NifX family protein
MTLIVLPTDDGRTLAHFGIARTFAVFDAQDSKILGREDRINPDPEHTHPAHHKLVLDLVRDCDVVVASHMGPPMVRSLKQLGKRVLLAPSEDVQASLGAYMEAPEGGLNEYTIEHAAPPPGHEPHDHQH